MTSAPARTLAPLQWLTAIQDQPFPVLFDSGHPDAPFGRYAILAAEPRCYWTALDADTLQTWHRQPAGGYRPGKISRGPVLQQFAALQSGVPVPTAAADNGVFNGGLIGLLPYESGAGAQGIESPARPPELPAAMLWGWVGDYDRALVIDHQENRLYRIGDCLHWQPASPAAPAPPADVGAILRTRLERPDYLQRLQRIQQYLRAGDIYQVNLTRHFWHPWQQDPVSTFARLRQATPMPFGGYLDLGDAQLLSLSPERFLQVRDGQLETRPIKGTRPRGADPATDEKLRTELQHSEKDRAENLMIVDLLRNDLGRSAAIGSVRVPRLFDIESFANVHQLVSTITARLPATTSPLQALAQAFPGGSITGAPKRRAMEIIAELEPHRRGPYCGSLFYQDVTGRLDSNILIRSVVLAQGQLNIWSGGGIVWDSDPAAEFQETHDKIGRLASALGLELP